MKRAWILLAGAAVLEIACTTRRFKGEDGDYFRARCFGKEEHPYELCKTRASAQCNGPYEIMDREGKVVGTEKTNADDLSKLIKSADNARFMFFRCAPPPEKKDDQSETA